jgi:hemolysin activation/secretion protein
MWVGVFFPAFTHAQLPPIDPTGRSGEPPALQQQVPKPTPAPSLILPPVPQLPETERGRVPSTRVFVSKINIIGNTVFAPEELAQITAAYENRQLGFEDLEALRVALTVNYVNRGYINSGAIIPDQAVTDGMVTIQIIEGELTGIELQGNKWFRDKYIRDRLALGVERPLNINTLQERMQLLLQDRRLERLNADLRPGLKLGESVLNVRVEDDQPFKLRLEYNNFQSPTLGANRGLVTFENQNVFGFGDMFSAQYGGSNGIHPQLDIRYTVPFTARDTTLSFNYRKNDSIVIEAPFEPLDIENKSEIFGITVRHPLYRTLNHEIALELTGERLKNETFLLGRPFSFSPGVHNGKAVVTALRFAQEWVGRSEVQVLAARSRFSFGLDALGSTTNTSSLPDSRFFAWLGQFQWARRLPFFGIETLFRTDVQLTNDPLFSLEQIAVGGRYSVRGYRENTLVRDNASISSLEVRIPLITDQPWADYIQLAPFYDIGHGWNRKVETPEPRTIHGVGVGLRWAATFRSPVFIRPSFEVYWGYPLTKVETQGGNLQDHGLHLQFSLALF